MLRIKLEDPILLQPDNDLIFMIAEFIEVEHECAGNQIIYCGNVYGYEYKKVELYHEGKWVYDLTLNVCLDNKGE